MKNTKILEMLNNSEIEQLKALLTEEIYQNSLKSDVNAKSRYSAMKRYFKFKNSNSDLYTCQYPCKDVEIDKQYYNSFVDGHCFALTTESVDTFETFDKTKGEYLNIRKLVNFSTAQSVEKIDLNSVLAKGKSKGYKYCKNEFDTTKFDYVFKYKDTYYKLGLLDKAYSIINDGEDAEVYYANEKSVLLIKTSIGIAGVLPLRKSDDIERTKNVICAKN